MKPYRIPIKLIAGALGMILCLGSCQNTPTPIEKPNPDNPEQPIPKKDEDPDSPKGTKWFMRQTEEHLIRILSFDFVSEDQVHWMMVDIDKRDGSKEVYTDKMCSYYYRKDLKSAYISIQGNGEVLIYKCQFDWASKIMYLYEGNEPPMPFTQDEEPKK